MEIDFNQVAFDHSQPNLAESMGVDLDEVDKLYQERVLPVVDELNGGKIGKVKVSVVVEAILKADIPQKVRVYMLVGLKDAIG